MKTLEILIITVLACYGCSLFISMKKRSSWFHLLPGLSVFLLVMHFVFEDYRWQMLPVYFYAVILFLITARNLRYARKPIDISTRQGRTVKGIDDQILNGSSPKYPEVAFKVKHNP